MSDYSGWLLALIGLLTSAQAVTGGFFISAFHGFCRALSANLQLPGVQANFAPVARVFALDAAGVLGVAAVMCVVVYLLGRDWLADRDEERLRRRLAAAGATPQAATQAKAATTTRTQMHPSASSPYTRHEGLLKEGSVLPAHPGITQGAPDGAAPPPHSQGLQRSAPPSCIGHMRQPLAPRLQEYRMQLPGPCTGAQRRVGSRI